MQSKQTIYGIARFFGFKPNDIYEINPQLHDHVVQVNEQILIPVKRDLLIYNPNNLKKTEEYVPIYYQVKAKDNFFRISRIYFDQSIENLLKINNVNSFELEIDQILLVGWIPVSLENRTKPVKLISTRPSNQQTLEEIKEKKNKTLDEIDLSEDKKDVGSKPVFKKKVKSAPDIALEREQEWKKMNESIDEIIEISKKYNTGSSINSPENPELIETETLIERIDSSMIDQAILTSNLLGDIPLSLDIKLSESKGIAIWKNSGSGKNKMFALHATARINSYIELENPMMNRVVYAKVIGNIPPNTYPEEVKVIISPKTASSLGVVDQRFFIKMKYLE
jgi:LysM repeat protein